MDLLNVEVTANEVVMAATHEIQLCSPELGCSSSPGQFLFVRCSPGLDPLLRRPISVYRIRSDGISFLVRAGGRGAGMIARSRPGERLDLLGPIGRPFSVDPARRHLLMVAEGYRAGALVTLAERMLPRGCEVVLLAGGPTADAVFPAGLVPSEVEYHVATADGSLGHAGPVTALVHDYLEWADAVYISASERVMEAVTRVCRPSTSRPGPDSSSKPLQLAMEQPMPCAVGVCLGCVVKTRRGYQRVCREGPVFDADDLVWGASA